MEHQPARCLWPSQGDVTVLVCSVCYDWAGDPDGDGRLVWCTFSHPHCTGKPEYFVSEDLFVPISGKGFGFHITRLY